MPNPLSSLGPVVDLLGENLHILPATGGAVEDLQHPDQEETDDRLINPDLARVDAFAETPKPSFPDIYRPTPALYRTEKHLYRFFIDGSLRTYYLATGIEGTRSFPIELAQIGAAVMHRQDDGHVRVFESRQSILLLVPRGAQGVSDTLWTQIERAVPPDGPFQLVDISDQDVLSGKTGANVDLRNKAGGKARHQMHKQEIDLIDETDGQRDDSNWLILDGAVKLGSFISKPHIIGVAKSFRKDPQFVFGRKRRERKDVTGLLAGLPHAHRTVAFSAHSGQVAFWYVRLREQKELDYPLMGVVKVELPRPDKSPVDADLADLLSRALVAERNVTPYGRDRRWHVHLYPIHMAEQAIRSKFFSQDVLLGSIRWSHPSSTT